jgi:hypothetical protein
VKGDAFLMKNNADDIWVYFKRTRRVRKLASHAKKQKLQGSDFTYEDMGSGNAWLEEYTSKRLKDQKIRGQKLIVIQLKAIPEKESSYSKIIVYSRPSDYFPLQIEYFSEESDKPFKTLYMEDIQIIDGIPTAMKMTMKNHLDDTETSMEVIEITYKEKLPESMFTERELGR